MARGATWDPDLEERVGEVIGAELRAGGATLTGAVCVNLLRHPAWGRAQETYGEDPHHVGELGAAFTRGLQRHVLACVKHFACNSMENARFKVDVTVDDVALHEVYLPHFRRIVDEGVASVMSAYNAVNGEWCGDNRALLTDVLRDEWGFEGFVISDWIFGLRDAARSLAAGLDVEMPYRQVRARDLPAALPTPGVGDGAGSGANAGAGDGDVAAAASWDDVVTSATRLVATRLRFDDILSAPAPDASVIAGDAHRALAREVAARSVLVLRNEEVAGTPALPLPDSGASVAVVGPLADTVNLGDGGSSDVWALGAVTVLAGLEEVAPALDLVHDPGDDPARAAALAAEADAAVVVVGCTYLDEGEFIGDTGVDLSGLFPAGDDPALVEAFNERLAGLDPLVVPDHVAARPASMGFATGGDRRSLRLADEDVALVRAVAAANARTVVVLQGGSAILTSEWDGSVAGLVHAWYGGSEAGTGLADVLVGRVNPSARLPFTVPSDEAHLPDFDREADRFTYDRWHGWWYPRRAGHGPAYPFGFGLSYTTFAVHDVDVSVGVDVVEVTATVTNTGAREGADVVQVYAELPDPDAPRRLVGFGRVEVPAGGSEPVAVMVPRDRLSRRDPDAARWLAAEGPHVIEVGRHAGDPAATRVTVEL